MFLYILCIFILFYVSFDVNYVLRTFFTVFIGKLYQRAYFLNEITTIYGICTLQDCDLWFRNVRIARLVREIDFARYHFYHRTGIYQRSRQLKIRSLQGCTFTVYKDHLPLFVPYKINTQLVYWDDCSLFFEHEVITLHDDKVRYFIISRQHAIGSNGKSSSELLEGLPGSENRPKCPKHIEKWLKSMQLTSNRLRNP